MTQKNGGYITTIYRSDFTTEAVNILSNVFKDRELTNIYTMEVNGVKMPVSKTYIFNNTTNNTVVFYFSKPIYDASSMFEDCTRLISIDLSNLVTSAIRYVSYMFFGCTSLASINLSNFNISNVSGIGCMFSYCRSLTSLDISSFNTSNVVDMTAVFGHCERIRILDLSNFDTSKTDNISGMFSSCYALKEVNLSSFNTSVVKYMNSMFSGCNSLISLDLSNFSALKNTNISYMFEGCSKLSSIKIMGDMSGISDTTYAFYNISPSGTFRYNNAYDYSKIISILPSSWIKVPMLT